jgi:hypothetical protein
MGNIDDATLAGLQDELEKIALLGALSKFVSSPNGQKMLGVAGSTLGHGAAIGAGLGALHGAVKNYEDAREQGAGVGASVGAGIGGALSEAGTGALYGGALGGLGGAAYHHLNPTAAAELRKKLMSTDKWYGALGRFGQRQVHGLTGWKPEEGLSSDAIRGGSWRAQQALEKAKTQINPTRSAIVAAKKMVDAEKGMEAAGLTNVPGMVAAAMGKGPKSRLDSLKAVADHQWNGQDMIGRGALLGLGVLPTIGALSAQDIEGGPGKGEQIGNAVGGLAGSLAGAALPVFPQGHVARAAGRIGQGVGKGVDWLRGRRDPHPATIQDREQSTSGGMHSVERVMSPTAAGEIPQEGR